MKVITFEGSLSIDNAKFGQFIETLTCLTPDKEEEVRIYFFSTGGNVDAMDMLLDIFSRLPYLQNITLIPMGYIASTAFTFFVKAKCKKEFVHDTVALIHMTQIEVSTRNFNDKYSYDYVQKNRVSINNKQQLKELASWGLTKHELNLIRTGNDLCVDVNRLEKICKLAEGLNVDPA